jgi:hypothetical protein
MTEDRIQLLVHNHVGHLLEILFNCQPTAVLTFTVIWVLRIE